MPSESHLCRRCGRRRNRALHAPVARAQNSYREDTNQKQLHRNVIATMSTHVLSQPNETQAQPRLSGTQVAAHGSTLATLDIQENDAVSAVGYSGPIRRFHLCSGEKHADSDLALPTGV